MRTAVRQAMWHHVMLQVRSLPGCPNMPKLKCCQARDFCLWKRQPLKSLPCLAQTCKELMGKGLQRRHWHDITRILDVPGLKSSNMFKWNQGRVFALQKLEPTSECKLWLHVVPCCSHTAGAGTSCIGLTPNGVGFAEWRMSTCSSNGPFPQFDTGIETTYEISVQLAHGS